MHTIEVEAPLRHRIAAVNLPHGRQFQASKGWESVEDDPVLLAGPCAQQLDGSRVIVAFLLTTAATSMAGIAVC
jgi:hypothetical protein